MKDQLNLSVLIKNRSQYLEEENGKMVALQIPPKIESMYGLGRQATKLFISICMEFYNFCEVPI